MYLASWAELFLATYDMIFMYVHVDNQIMHILMYNSYVQELGEYVLKNKWSYMT